MDKEKQKNHYRKKHQKLELNKKVKKKCYCEQASFLGSDCCVFLANTSTQHSKFEKFEVQQLPRQQVCFGKSIATKF